MPADHSPLELVDDCATTDRDFLRDRIDEFNVMATGIDDGRELAIFIRDDTESIVAGLYGWTWGGVCEIASLWVHEAHRNHGIGARLLRAAEEEARRRGARSIELGTHSFQAPDFYRGFGYTVVGRRENYPTGHSQLLLTKPLI